MSMMLPAKSSSLILPCCCEEVFFPVLPLAEVERFVSSSGSLKLKAEVLFHFTISKVPRLLQNFVEPVRSIIGLWATRARIGVDGRMEE